MQGGRAQDPDSARVFQNNLRHSFGCRHFSTCVLTSLLFLETRPPSVSPHHPAGWVPSSGPARHAKPCRPPRNAFPKRVIPSEYPRMPSRTHLNRVTMVSLTANPRDCQPDLQPTPCSQVPNSLPVRRAFCISLLSCGFSYPRATILGHPARLTARYPIRSYAPPDAPPPCRMAMAELTTAPAALKESVRL